MDVNVCDGVIDGIGVDEAIAVGVIVGVKVDGSVRSAAICARPSVASSPSPGTVEPSKRCTTF